VAFPLYPEIFFKLHNDEEDAGFKLGPALYHRTITASSTNGNSSNGHLIHSTTTGVTWYQGLLLPCSMLLRSYSRIPSLIPAFPSTAGTLGTIGRHLAPRYLGYIKEFSIWCLIYLRYTVFMHGTVHSNPCAVLPRNYNNHFHDNDDIVRLL
jgi:hypothetical protein